MTVTNPECEESVNDNDVEMELGCSNDIMTRESKENYRQTPIERNKIAGDNGDNDKARGQNLDNDVRCAEYEELCELINGTGDRNKYGDVVVDDGDGNNDVIMEEENSAPDGGWGWWIVVGVLLLRTFIGGLARANGLLYLRFLDRYNGSATATSLVTSINMFVRLSSGPVVSLMTGRFQCRVLTGCGAVLSCLGLILTGYAPSLEFLYFSFGVIAGLGRSLAVCPCIIILGKYFNKRRSLAFGLASAGFSIGGFTITPLIELLFHEYAYQGTFLILGAASLNILVATCLFRPIESNKQHKRSKQTTELVPLSSDNDVTIRNKEPLIKHAGAYATDTLYDATAVNRLKQVGDDNCLLENTEKGINADNYHGDEVLLKRGLNNDNNNHTKTWTEYLLCRRKKQKSTNVPKKKLISWSILKDVRFMCFVIATFCFTLPSNAIFLPALAVSKGCTDFQAASLLSISSGSDTVFRVLSGIILDLKMLRNVRPQVYSVLTILQALVVALFPSIDTYTQFVALSSLEGGLSGARMAQGNVILLDMLGVDKLASSLAVTNSVQCVAAIIGPTFSGQLKDRYGTYDGAFYFSAGALFVAGVVMVMGNIYKKCVHTKTKSQT